MQPRVEAPKLGLFPERPGHDEKHFQPPQLLQRGKGAGNGVNDSLTGFRELPGGAPQLHGNPLSPLPEHLSLPLAAYVCPLSYPLMNW